jgi:hypothetical protein
MADRFPGEITIGGKVPATLLQEFLGELNSTSAKVGAYDGAEFVAKTAADLRGVLDENGHLFLADDRAPNGQFAELEDFCVRHGIPFDRHSDARHGFKAENVTYRPGMKRPAEMPSDDSGDALLRAETVRPIAKELARLVTTKLTREKVLAAAKKVIRHLYSLLPPEIEPLPPLEIVEE